MDRERENNRQNSQDGLFRPSEINRDALKREKQQQPIYKDASHAGPCTGSGSEQSPVCEDLLHRSLQRACALGAARSGLRLLTREASSRSSWVTADAGA